MKNRRKGYKKTSGLDSKQLPEVDRPSNDIELSKEGFQSGDRGYIVRDLEFADHTPEVTYYPDQTFVFASIPALERNVNPGETTECIFRGTVARRAPFTAPGFPHSVARVTRSCYHISQTADMGLGMFANRDIKMGELVLAERPLMVTPGAVNLKIDYLSDFSNDEKRKVVMAEWEKVLNKSFKRLTPENQAALLALAHADAGDGSGPLLRVIRTNGFVVTLGVGFFKDYSAVCKDMSRVNHSCSPNAAINFFQDSFSFQLRAVTDIRENEQIYISYCSVNLPMARRQENLVSYGFQCACVACTSSTSDHLRSRILDSIVHLSDSYNEWIRNISLPDNHLIKPSLLWLSLMEKEGMKSSNAYEHHLQAIMRAYSALGDMENTLKFGRLSALWNLAVMGNDKIGKDLENSALHQATPYWRARPSNSHT